MMAGMDWPVITIEGVNLAICPTCSALVIAGSLFKGAHQQWHVVNKTTTEGNHL
jgi:hypothetical protein